MTPLLHKLAALKASGSKLLVGMGKTDFVVAQATCHLGHDTTGLAHCRIVEIVFVDRLQILPLLHARIENTNEITAEAAVPSNTVGRR